MITSGEPAKVTGGERRLSTGVPVEVSIAVVGGLILLVADAWALSLIPLLANMEKTYSLSPSQAAWAMSVSGLVAAGLVPTVARLGDRLGMRLLIVVSLAIGLVGNVVCAVAPGFAVLLAGRAIIGASAVLPLIFALVRARGTSAQRVTRGVAILSAASGIGVAVAYLLSGLVIQAHGSVRTVFWVISALAAVSLVVAWLYLPDSDHRERKPLDWGGVVGVCVGLVFVVLAITEGNSWGWSSGGTLASLFGGLAVLLIFTFYETRVANPLINVARISNRTAAPTFFVLAILSSATIYANLAQSAYTQMPTAAGYPLGLSVLQSSATLCTIAVSVLVGGLVAHNVINRFGPRPVMVVTSAVLAANFAVLAYWHTGVWQFVVWDLIWGVGFSFVYTAANAAFLHDATSEEAAMYSSANTVITAAIAGLGPALFVSVLTSKFIPHTPIPDPSVFRSIWIYAAIAMVAIAGMAVLVRPATFVPHKRPAARADVPGSVAASPDRRLSGICAGPAGAAPAGPASRGGPVTKRALVVVDMLSGASAPRRAGVR